MVLENRNMSDCCCDDRRDIEHNENNEKKYTANRVYEILEEIKQTKKRAKHGHP